MTRIYDGTVSAVTHPIGFMLIDLSELADVKPTQQCRLHIWSRSRERNDGLGYIHDHSWALTSAVLLGELVDIDFTASSDPHGSYEFVRVTYGSESENFDKVGLYNLKVQRQRQLRAPVVYRLDAEVLHETDILSDAAVTLVIADRRESPTYKPLVVISDDNFISPADSRPAIPSEQAGSIIGSLLDTIRR